MSSPADRESRVLICAPRGRDAAVVDQLLARSGIAGVVCADLAGLAAELGRGAAAAIVTEETLAKGGVEDVFDWLATQPPWSDFPFIVLSTGQAGRRPEAAAKMLERLGGVVLLERPINAETLTSAAASALRARGRQYDARARLLELEQTQERLRAGEAELRRLNATLERRVEEALAGRKVLSDIFESTDAFLQVLDHDYRLLAVNKASADTFERLFGRRPTVGDNVLDLLAHVPRHRETARALWARALGGEIFTEVQSYGPPGPEQVHYEVQFKELLDAEGRRIGAYQFVYDVTERIRGLQRLGEAEDRLRQSQKLEAVGQLTGGVAHDFNNLLTVIGSSVSLMRRPDLPEERRRRYMDAITETVGRAAKLTGQLLAFARRQPLKPEVFDVGLRVESVAELVRPLMGARIRVEVEITPDPAAYCVEADAGQFETALVNLAVNARDAMDGEGGLTFRIRRGAPASLADAPCADFVAVEVADTGTGIAPDQLGKIFEPFYTTKPVGQGTGLGLSQVFGFAKQSQGEVDVSSTLGRGTTFIVYLPRTELAPAEVAAASAQRVVGGRGTRLLMVEDNPDVGRFSTEMLRDLGYETTLAANGQEALDLLAANDAGFDLVFSDVIMPGMNGLELARTVRRRYPDLPVVLTSGYSDVLAAEGPRDFELLRKPYTVEGLARVLGQAAASRAATG